MVDDVYLNGYAKILGSHASCVYFSLCRHADKEQSAFPSEELIAKEFDMDKRTVIRKLKLLEEWNIIRIERTRDNQGKWLRNTYYLLDKEEWKQPSDTESHGVPSDSHVKNQVTLKTFTQVTQSHLKDTHYIKDTHIKSECIENTLAFLQNIPEEQVIEITTKYNCTDVQLRDKADTLRNYCLAHGKKYKDYRAFLLNAVKKDFGLRAVKNATSQNVDWDNLLKD